MELIGKKFDRLTVLEKRSIKRRTYYKCICDCGNNIIARKDHLKSNRIKSCGCLKIERLSIHGNTTSFSKTKEYRAWQNMKNRCYNPKYNGFKNWGGRGIKICDRWLNSFKNFLNDVGEAPSSEHSIDRINNDGDYEPGNVRWVTQDIQNNNQSNSKHVFI